jgi:hypothetical protein
MFSTATSFHAEGGLEHAIIVCQSRHSFFSELTPYVDHDRIRVLLR